LRGSGRFFNRRGATGQHGPGHRKEIVSMSFVLAIGLIASASEPTLPLFEHRAELEHAGGVVEAHYRTRVSLVSRQTGSVTNGGTPSTLRCVWRADISVERQARYGAKVRLARGIDRQGVVEGSRPGWCGTNREAIAREVARRADEIQTHLAAVAQEDETVLKAELARMDAGHEG
jgi:hypothetical protein